MAGKKREIGRIAANVYGVFGLPSGPLDYLTFVQLALNEERVSLRQGMAVAQALAALSSDEPLGACWADALGWDPLEGGERVDQANAARATQRARRQMAGWIGG